MLPEPSMSVLKAVTLTGKALNKWRRHNEVHNLKRELKKALHADHRVPPADRESLRGQVDLWLFDPIFLGGLSIYVEDADRSPLPEIQARLRDLIKLTDPADVPAVAAVVVETIEVSVTRAKRSDRRAAYHESRAGEQRVLERIDRVHEAIIDQGSEHEKRLDEQERLIRRLTERMEGKAPEAETSISHAGAEDARDPEHVLEALQATDQAAAERLRTAWEAQDGSLVRLLEDETSWVQEAHADVWEATGRLLAESGQFAEAEQAYLAAVDRGHGDPIRQLARASSAASIRGDDDRAKELLALASGTEGGEDHPAVALREIEGLDDSQEMLRRLDLLEPSSPREEAAREVLRARAHLLEDAYEPALAAANRALEFDAKHAGAYAMRGLARFGPEREAFARRDTPDRAIVAAAIEDFTSARDLLRAANRWRESAQMAGHVAEAHFVADDPARAAQAILPPEVLEEERRDAGTHLAHVALMLGQGDVVSDLIDEEDLDDRARVFRLSAVARGADSGQALAAVEELRALMDSPEGGVPEYAALSLLFAAGRHKEVGWDERAETHMVDGPDGMLPVLRSDYLQVQGDLQGAENELLKLSDDPGAAHALITLALVQEEWETAKLRAEALLRIEDTGRNRLLFAHVLRSAGEPDEALAELDRIARDDHNSPALRGGAYQRGAEIASERRDWATIERLARDWRELLADDLQAAWFHALALARLARHPEALALWEVDLLTVSTRDHAVLLAEILMRAADAATAVREISGLSAQFGRDDERLEFLVIMSALRRKEALPDDLDEVVRETFESFPKKFPESQMLWVEPAPTTPEEFDAFAGKFAREGEDLTQEFHDKILAGEAPVASLAAAAGKDISTIWCRLPFLPLGYSDETLDALERGDAAQAIGRPAVWDPTSLLVVSDLDDDVALSVRNALLGSVISNSTLDESDHAATEVGGEKTGEMGYDRTNERGYLVEHGREQVAREQDRASSMAELAKSLEPAFDADPESDDPWATLLSRDDDSLHRQLAAWASTMAVARRLGLPIYSDDRFIRMAARREGIPAFGTLALIDALTDRGILDQSERVAIRRALLRSGAWGVRSTAGELIEAADEDGWVDVREVEVALHDRSAWANDTVQSWYRAADVLCACFEAAPEHLERWTVRVLDAAAAGRPGISNKQHVHSLLVSCLDILDDPPKYPEKFFHQIVGIAKRLPCHLRPWPPVDVPLEMIASIMETASVLDEPNRTMLFWRMWRRLPGPDQFRAFLAFVALPPRPRSVPAPARPRKQRRQKRKRRG